MTAAIIPYVLSGVGTIMQYSAQKAAGKAAQQQAAMQAEQIRQQSEMEARANEVRAGEERSTAQRLASEARRVARIKQSRALAVAAASGAGTVDPTIINIIGGLGEEGRYNADSELFKGEDSAKYREWLAQAGRVSGRNQANMALYGGAVAKKSYDSAAMSTLVQGGASMYSIYNKGKVGADTPVPEKSAPAYGGYSEMPKSKNWWE